MAASAGHRARSEDGAEPAAWVAVVAWVLAWVQKSSCAKPAVGGLSSAPRIESSWIACDETLMRKLSRGRSTLTLVACGALLAVLLACKKVGNTSGSCTTGNLCECDQVGNCEQTCQGGGCQFKCAGMGNCKFSCPDGKCVVQNEATGNLSLDCAGGDCKLSSSGTGNVIVDCAGGSCTVSCSGTGSCQIQSCNSGCTVNCTGTANCTCAGGC
jgi:hypothetical protein